MSGLGNDARSDKVGRLRAAVQTPFIALSTAKGGLFAWVPVMMAIGVGAWFALPFEPKIGHYAAMLAALGLFWLCYRFGPELLHPLVIGLACCLIGMLAAGARAHLIDAPVLGFRYYGPVEGRVITIDRSQSDMMRLTLDRVVLSRVSPAKTPARVRVSLHGEQGFFDIKPGQIVVTTAHLSAPDGPVEPGGFDFRRMAFFDRLGAVGYTRVPVLLLAPPLRGVRNWSTKSVRRFAQGWRHRLKVILGPLPRPC